MRGWRRGALPWGVLFASELAGLVPDEQDATLQHHTTVLTIRVRLRS